MVRFVFNYFNGRGLGEAVRFTLAAANLEWEEKYVTTKEEFAKLKEDGLLLWGQLPLLQAIEENGETLNIVQSYCIIRYIAKNYNLYGNENENLLVDVIADGVRDVTGKFVGYSFLPSQEAKDNLVKTIKERVPTFFKTLTQLLLQNNFQKYSKSDNAKITEFIQNNPPIPVLSQSAKQSWACYGQKEENENYYLVGGSLTYCDAVVLETLEYFEELAREFIEENFPVISIYHRNLRDQCVFKKFFNSTHRHPPGWIGEYVNNVKSILY